MGSRVKSDDKFANLRKCYYSEDLQLRNKLKTLFKNEKMAMAVKPTKQPDSATKSCSTTKGSAKLRQNSRKDTVPTKFNSDTKMERAKKKKAANERFSSDTKISDLLGKKEKSKEPLSNGVANDKQRKTTSPKNAFNSQKDISSIKSTKSGNDKSPGKSHEERHGMPKAPKKPKSCSGNNHTTPGKRSAASKLSSAPHKKIKKNSSSPENELENGGLPKQRSTNPAEKFFSNEGSKENDVNKNGLFESIIKNDLGDDFVKKNLKTLLQKQKLASKKPNKTGPAESVHKKLPGKKKPTRVEESAEGNNSGKKDGITSNKNLKKPPPKLKKSNEHNISHHKSRQSDKKTRKPNASEKHKKITKSPKRKYPNQHGSTPPDKSHPNVLNIPYLDNNLDMSADFNGVNAEYFFDEEEEDSDFDPFDLENLSDYSNDYSFEEEQSFSDSYIEDESYSEDDFDYGDLTSLATDSDDEDYQLPRGVAEDVIIHRGTADKRALDPADNVNFESGDECCQIVELPEQQIVKTIEQHSKYEREELCRLNAIFASTVGRIGDKVSKDISTGPIEYIDRSTSSDPLDCPQLVQADICSVCSDCSGCSDASFEDASSITNSEDISEKYVYVDCYSYQDFEATQMEATVISAPHCPPNTPNIIDTDYVIDGMSSVRQRLSSSADIFPPTIRQAVPEIIIAPVFDDEKTPRAKRLQNSTEDECSLGFHTPGFVSAQTSCNNVDISDEQLENETLDFSSEPMTENTDLYLDTQSDLSNSQSSNLRSIFANAINLNYVLVLLKDPFYVYGTVHLELLAGNTEVYGYRPKAKERLEIFSPRGYCAVKIEPKPSTDETMQELDPKILQRLKEHFHSIDLQNICSGYEPGRDALILLERNTSRKALLNNLRKYMSENVFPNVTTMNMSRPMYISECLLNCVINTSTMKPLNVPDDWSRLTLKRDSRMMIVGGKAVGKSTLVRYLVNKNLSTFEKVLLIDFDIGQPEIFVPQTVSCFVINRPLLGPGYFLNLQPAKSYAVGNVNIMLCTKAYMAALKQLLRFCHLHPDYRTMPWLINTMGYNKGFGMEIFAAITKYLKPTDVVQLQSNKQVNNFDILLESQHVNAVICNFYANDNDQGRKIMPDYKLHVLQSPVIQESRFMKEWEMTPKDMRYTMILARLSEAMQGKDGWLTDCKPFVAPLEDLKLVNMLSSNHTREELLKSTEANLVYLCHWEQDGEALRCYGIGVVRAIDYQVGQIYLIPAMPHSYLAHVNCIAIGEMPLPSSMFTNQGPKVKNGAPFVSNTVEAEATKSIKQIFYRPQEFLVGKHKKLIET